MEIPTRLREDMKKYCTRKLKIGRCLESCALYNGNFCAGYYRNNKEYHPDFINLVSAERFRGLKRVLSYIKQQK